MVKDLKEAAKLFRRIRDDMPNLFDDILKELGARFLSVVIPLTPVAENYKYEDKDGIQYVAGGNLRRSWIGENTPGSTPNESEIRAYVNGLSTEGSQITIANTAEYAIYVNYGHLQKPGRYVPAIGKRLVKNFVDGVKFKERAEEEFRAYIPQICEDMVRNYYKIKWNKR